MELSCCLKLPKGSFLGINTNAIEIRTVFFFRFLKITVELCGVSDQEKHF